jgi:polar amino acid transport system substrate-binding protein
VRQMGFAWIVALCVALSGCASVAPLADARAVLAPTGKLRVGVYLGNPLSAVRDPDSQQLKGAAMELGQHLARRLDVPFEAVAYPSVGALLEGAKSNQWDVAQFQSSPARAKEFDFTPPVVEIELGYLVPGASRLASAEGVDAAGTRIAVQENSQAGAILSRQLTRASLVPVGGLAAAVDAVKSGRADAIATVKPSLFELARQFPGSRVLEGRFARESIAMAIPRGREAGMPFLREFVESAKSQGLVATAIERSGARGALVAPPQGLP